MNSLITIVPGYGFGKTLIIEDFNIKPSLKIVSDPSKELDILDQAFKTFRNELEEMLHHSSSHDVLSFQYAMSLDTEFTDTIKHHITSKKMNASNALRVSLDNYISLLSHSKSDYMKARIHDFESFYERMVYIIQGIPFINVSTIQENVIIVLKTLNLHLMNQFNPIFVKGIITASQSLNSHAAIIAKQKGIPTLFGVPDLEAYQNDEMLIIDTLEKNIMKNPSQETLSFYQEKYHQHHQDQELLTSFKDLMTRSHDGIFIPLLANMSSLVDLDAMSLYGVEGIGLIRTELLFIDKLLPPSLENQIDTYIRIIKKITPKIITFRLFDIGGDKHVPFIRLEKEENPLLGSRGIRLFDAYKHIFYTQIKALLIASTHGDIHVLIPMVSTKKEILEVLDLIQEVKVELNREHILFGNVKVGVMIEVPSLALSAHLIAPIVDFFSIGTNDLIQYTMATDRSMMIDDQLSDPYHPSILSLIHHVIKSALKHHIPVSVCGEIASNPLYASLLIAFGISSLSLVPNKILTLRKHIHTLDITYLRSQSEQLLTLEDRNDIQALLTKKPS
jgi:phosphoenolpyruvate-protein phosphotransferase (PTS system enzyme I)